MGFLRTSSFISIEGQSASGETDWIDVSNYSYKSFTIIIPSSGTVSVQASNREAKPTSSFGGAVVTSKTSSSYVEMLAPVRWIKVLYSGISGGGVNIHGVGIIIKEKYPTQ